MKVNKNNHEKKIILQLNWFEKNYGFIGAFLLFLFVNLNFISFLFRKYLGPRFLRNPFFAFVFIVILLFQLYIPFSYNYLLEINFEQEKILSYMRILRMRKKKTGVSISEIRSLISDFKYSKMGMDYQIKIMKSNCTIQKKPLLNLSSIQRTLKFNKYYIDLFNVSIVNTLKEKGFNITSLVKTDTSRKYRNITLLNLNSNNLKAYAKELSNAKQFTVFDPLFWVFIIGDGLFLAGLINVIFISL